MANELQRTKPIGLSEAEEGYVEVIYSLIKEHGYARVADVAAALNVKPPSVTNMLQRLDKHKFVTYKRYRGVVLTRKGIQLAETLEKRHRALKNFLVMIGVNAERAEQDACEIEHKMTRETVEKLAKFVEFVNLAPQAPPFLEHFKHYEKTGERPKQCYRKNQKKESK